MKILWLASWYPDQYEGNNGDFVQRHAQAVSTIIPLHLIHVVQAGYATPTLATSSLKLHGNLLELNCSFRWQPIGWKLMDQIRYNKTYLQYYRNLLLQYEQEYGIPDLIHVQAPMKAGMLAIEFAKRWKRNFLVTEHSSMYDPAAKDQFFTRSTFFQRQTRRIYKNAVAVVHVSKSMEEKVNRIFDSKRTMIIPNAVDTDQFHPIKRKERPVFRWLHVSSLYPLKNVEGILAALKIADEKYGDWELTIVGGDPAYLVRLATSMGLEAKVRFTGELPHSMVATTMQAADALILFSKHENFPCVIIEALCCGVPVLSSNVGGVAEAVHSGNGQLVESGNVEALAAAMLQMMEGTVAYDNHMIATTAAALYNFNTVGNKFVTLYHEILSR